MDKILDHAANIYSTVVYELLDTYIHSIANI